MFCFINNTRIYYHLPVRPIYMQYFLIFSVKIFTEHTLYFNMYTSRRKEFSTTKICKSKTYSLQCFNQKTIPNFIFLLTYIQKEMVNLNDIYKVQTSNTISLSEHFCLTFNNKYKRFACINGY